MHRLPVDTLERAARLLSHEATLDAAEDSSVAGRAYDKLFAQIATLVGAAGTEALFVRSAKLQDGGFEALADVSVLDGAEKLRAFLHKQEPALPAEFAAALFGTFLSLITKFIGERLTTQAVRRAWPTLRESSGETSS